MISQRLLQAGAKAVAIYVVFEGPSSKGPADDAAMTALLNPLKGRVALAAECSNRRIPAAPAASPS